jgi:flagellar biosynthesis/type III secretory pathway protein FliH
MNEALEKAKKIVRSAKDQITADAMAELRDLLPKGVHVNQAWKIHKEEITDILYQLYVAGEESGDQDGYDRGYDEGYTDGNDDGYTDGEQSE